MTNPVNLNLKKAIAATLPPNSRDKNQALAAFNKSLMEIQGHIMEAQKEFYAKGFKDAIECKWLPIGGAPMHESLLLCGKITLISISGQTSSYEIITLGFKDEEGRFNTQTKEDFIPEKFMFLPNIKQRDAKENGA